MSDRRRYRRSGRAGRIHVKLQTFHQAGGDHFHSRHHAVALKPDFGLGAANIPAYEFRPVTKP